MNCWKPNPNTKNLLNSMDSFGMVISIQALQRCIDGSTTRKSKLMTERQYINEKGIKCAGCSKTFGRINIVHITKCAGLKKLGIKTREQYKESFGKLSSDYLIRVATKVINHHNSSTTSKQRSEWGRLGYDKACKTNPDFCRQGGLKGSKALWKKTGQKERHRKRTMELNAKGFMSAKPNKLETYFSEMINDNNLVFKGHQYWKTIKTDRGFKNITPDFKVKGRKIVVEIFGNYWHKPEEEKTRIQQWESVGLKCIVFWEKDIRNNIDAVKKDYYKFISQNSHECSAPVVKSQGDDIV